MVNQSGRIELLLVDDEEDFLRATAQALRRRGFAVTTVSSGALALEMLRHAEVDLVVLDLKMPGLGGEDVLVRLRQVHPGLPVIVLTGRPDAAQAFRLAQLGAVEYLTKPCPIELLATSARNVASSARAEKKPKPNLIQILCASADAATQTEISQALRGREIEVESVLSAAAAVARLRAGGIAAVLWDLDCFGLEPLESLRQRPQVLLLCAHPTIALVRNGLALGAYDFLAKPFLPDELLVKVRSAARRSQAPSNCEALLV